MEAVERQRYRKGIADEIAQWAPEVEPDDPWWPLIEKIPACFDTLAGLAADRALGDDQRRVVRRVIKYLISPLDLRPEFIYGPDGLREDLALIALAVRWLCERPGPEALRRHGLEPESTYWQDILRLAEADLDADLYRHLELLLAADAVAGDEDLAWAETADDLIAPKPQLAIGGHTIVFAGPGTGKTYRIEQELDRLLNDEAVVPESILVTTFTHKAADELRLRMHQRLRRCDAATADAIMQRLSISTIHSFCFQLISRFHHHALFLKGTFSPMDETQRMLFLFRHGRELKLWPLYSEWKAARKAQPGWAPVDPFHFYAYAGEIFDLLSEDVLRGTEPGLRHRYLQVIHGADTGSVDERIIAAYPRYWQRVQAEGFLDHSMQLAYAEALLDDPQVRRHVQGTYRHVLVDEYQDTNPIQDRLFRAVVGRTGRLFAVADDDQSIYAFRGADVRNATEFAQRWPGAQVEKLEENRRSTGALVDAASQIIGRNRVREPKQIHTRNPRGSPPWCIRAEKDTLPDRVAELLGRMRAAGLIPQWRDVALLFRVSTRIGVWQRTLSEAGIPAQIAGDHRFLKRPVIRAFLAILEIITPSECGLTPRKRVHRPWFQALEIDDREEMARLVHSWHERLHDDGYASLLDLFYSILDDCGALDAEDLLPELGRLSVFIAEAEAQLTSPELLKRLSWFNTYAQAAADGFEGPAEAPTDAVSLMTLHKSKGLEFPVVVIADVSEGIVPADFGQDLRGRLRRELAGLDSHLDATEEERRVLYVGMTRAQNYLILAAAAARPSPFLAEFEHEPPPAELPEPAGRPRHRPGRNEPPLHVHHSAVYNYHFCPRRYLLESRYGFAGRVIAPLRAGQSLHRALEIYHRLQRDGERVTPGRRERIFERAWLRPRAKRAAAKEWNELFGVFNAYADRWESRLRQQRLRTVEVESPFFVAQGRGVMTGRIDLVREREDRLELVEFKYRRNQMLRMRDYPRLQLEHYSLAYPEEQPGLVVYYLHEGVEEEVPHRPPGPVRQELDAVFHNIAAAQFAPRPARQTCRLCPVRFACNAAATV